MLTALVPTSSTSSNLGPLLPLAERASKYATEARSARTRESYQAHWRHFVGWCAQHRLQPLPAAPETLALYMTARADEGRKVATLSLSLAAISQAHQMEGHESPRAHRTFREIWKGIRRTLGTAQKQKQPLLDPQVRALASSLPDTLAGARDRALLLVGFAGAFRRSELVALTVGDVAFSNEGLTVTLRWSKSDQERRGRSIGIPYGRSAATCPVRSTRAWLELSGISEGPLFRTVDRHGNMGGPMSGRDVANVIKRRTSAMGLNSAEFSGHSLRAGLATSAAKAGKAAHSIMKTTGHRSVAMVMRYVRDSELFVDNAAAGLL